MSVAPQPCVCSCSVPTRVCSLAAGCNQKRLKRPMTYWQHLCQHRGCCRPGKVRHMSHWQAVGRVLWNIVTGRPCLARTATTSQMLHCTSSWPSTRELRVTHHRASPCSDQVQGEEASISAHTNALRAVMIRQSACSWLLLLARWARQQQLEQQCSNSNGL
jgi:hypothetical protein